MSNDADPSPLLGYLVGAASLVLVVAGLKLAAPIVNLVLMSFLLAFTISPIQNWLICRKFPKGLAVFVTVLLIIVGGSVLISILAASVGGLIGKLPDYEIKLTGLWNAINAFFLDHHINISGLLSLKEFDPKQLVAVAGNLLGTVLQGLSNGVFVIIITVFVLVELSAMQFHSFRDRSVRTGFQKRVNQVVGDVGKYIAITGWNGLINAAANFLWLLVLGVDFALTWAVISFLFNFVPNFGFVMAVIPPAAIALLEYGWVRALLVIVGYVIFNFIAESVIKPRTMKARLDISPLLTILSVIFSGLGAGRARRCSRRAPDDRPSKIGKRTSQSRPFSAMISDREAPSLGRRALAVLAMLAAAALVVELVVFVANNIGWLIVALAGLAIAAAGGWWALTERMPRRAVGIAGLVAGAAVIIVAVFQAVQGAQSPLVRIAVVLALLAVATLAARWALAPDLRETRARSRRDTRPPAASRC